MMSFCRDRQGGMSILAAGVLFLLMLLAVLIVDCGMLYAEKERLQGAVDRAALVAATDPAHAAARAGAVIAANIANPVGSLDIAAGQYPPPGYTMATAAALPPGARFTPAAAGNAIRVTARSRAPLFFARLLPGADGTVAASAVALNAPVTQIMAGTQFADLDLASVPALNAVLSALLGREVALSAPQYQALLAAPLSLPAILDRVIAALALPAGDYGAVLKADLSLSGLLDAIEATDSTLASALQPLRTAAAGLGGIELGTFLLFDSADPHAVAGTTIGAFDLISAAIAAWNADHGLALTQTVDLGASTASLSAHVVSPPRISAVGGVGISVETAQVRLYLKVDAGTVALPVLGTLLSVTLPLYLEEGSGTATVTAISCPGPDAAGASVGVAATPGLLSLSIGEVDPAALAETFAPAVNDATLLSLAGILAVTAGAKSTISGGKSNLLFTAPFTQAHDQIAPLAGRGDGMTSNLVATLHPDVDVLGLPLLKGTIEAALPGKISTLLATLAPAIDGFFGAVQGLFGLDAGYMKVADTFLACNRPLLAGD
jgi:uncharacterized membrane protein